MFETEPDMQVKSPNESQESRNALGIHKQLRNIANSNLDGASGYHALNVGSQLKGANLNGRNMINIK
jgi:uncharacterized protein YjbI with pentapeptide repeats